MSVKRVFHVRILFCQKIFFKKENRPRRCIRVRTLTFSSASQPGLSFGSGTGAALCRSIGGQCVVRPGIPQMSRSSAADRPLTRPAPQITGSVMISRKFSLFIFNISSQSMIFHWKTFNYNFKNFGAKSAFPFKTSASQLTVQILCWHRTEGLHQMMNTTARSPW